MLTDEYEFALEKMGLTNDEIKETEGFPVAVKYGYICAKRKANGGRRDNSGRADFNLGNLFGRL